MVDRVTGTKGAAGMPPPERRPEISKKLKASKEHTQKAVENMVLHHDKASFTAKKGPIGTDLSQITLKYFG